jgi:predicted O-linked N-acetylglucosamine transferase (SPINDLY family)
MAYAASGRLREAKRCFTKALGIKADYAEAHSNLGAALKGLGQPKEAERSYRRAVALKPDSAQVHYNLGNLLLELDRPAQAEEHFRRAVALQPGYVAAHNNLGNALARLHLLEEAESSFRAAIAFEPRFIEAHHNLGNLLKDSGRLEQAAETYRAALELDAQTFESKTNLGNVLQRLGQFEEAVRCHREAMELRPDAALAHYNLGSSLYSLDQWKEAASSCLQAVRLDPNFPAARWGLAMAQLPSVYEEESQLPERRAAFSAQLDSLARWLETHPSAEGPAAFVQQPFNLAYQEENNRDLLTQYGRLCTMVMERWRAKQHFPTIAKPKSKAIKLGIVSAHIYDHSVWNALVKGWLQHMDPERIEFHLFHLGLKSDEETQFAKSRAAHFKQGARSLRDWAATILEHQLDVLAFPEIGMHTLTGQLASLRLAPVQLASWGHPETTGIPTVDYYISADGLEPSEAELNYTERLVRMPNLGCCYQRYAVTPIEPDLAAMGIAEDRPLFLCCGTAFKYRPSYDRILTSIAGELGPCQFVFFKNNIPAFSDKLHDRLKRTFDGAGLDFERYVVFVPWQPRARFYGLMQRADVFLDTIGFSGFNTAMQAVECALPIVASQGRFMRGRLASGILKRIQLEECVAASEARYIELAVKLGRNARYRAEIRARIEASRDILYQDTAAITAFQRFLAAAVMRLSR